ncbi:MAG: leucine-rich repeat protein [Fretibacterium sp.]|nr:leucine-rich repeat protein [Fretibacterium sp.]
MNRKLCVSLLALLVCCFMMPVPFAEADGGACGNGLTWDFTDSTLTISGSGAMKDKESPWSSHSENIKTIIIGKGVTHIGAKAFYNYHRPTRLVISDTVETIGDAAFYDCWGINSLTMGSSVKTIGNEAFLNCSGFTTLILPDTLTSIGEKAFYQCFLLSKLTFMVPKNNLHDLEVGANAFGENNRHGQVAYSSEKGILKYKGTEDEVAEGSVIDTALSGKSLTWSEHTPVNYVVTFDPNDGGMLKAGITTQRISVDQSAPLLTKEQLDLQNLDTDLEFMGWALSKDARIAEYADGAEFKPADDTTLYAVWRSEYLITFDANGGTFTTDNPTMTIQRGGFMRLTPAAQLGLSNEDTTQYFTGWSETEDGEVKYADGARCTPVSDMTLYAVWRKNGNGSEGDPFLIDNAERLKKLEQDVNVSQKHYSKHYSRTYFRLTAELEILSDDWTPIGKNYSNAFNGVFDGGGHNVTYRLTSSDQAYQGLFGCIDTGAVIRNLAVHGIINGNGKYCGGIAGWVSTSCTVRNCSSSVDVTTATKFEGAVGGIAGCSTGLVDYCSAVGTILNSGKEDICVGGVVGMNQGGTVSHCSSVNIKIGTTQNYVGRVVGSNKEQSLSRGMIFDCNYLAFAEDSYKGVGGYGGGSDTGTKRMTAKEMIDYAKGLSDEYAVCRDGILSMGWGGSDIDDDVRRSSSSGCDAGLWGLWGVYGAVLSLLLIKRR